MSTKTNIFLFFQLKNSWWVSLNISENCSRCSMTWISPRWWISFSPTTKEKWSMLTVRKTFVYAKKQMRYFNIWHQPILTSVHLVFGIAWIPIPEKFGAQTTESGLIVTIWMSNGEILSITRSWDTTVKRILKVSKSNLKNLHNNLVAYILFFYFRLVARNHLCQQFGRQRIHGLYV